MWDMAQNNTSTTSKPTASLNGIGADLNRLNRSAQRKLLAAQAEEHVAALMIHQGWRIIARNYRWIGTEIDILATKGSSLVAVEVKFRSIFSNDMTSVEELLPHHKIRALKKGLGAAMRHLRVDAPKIRSDLAIVTPRNLADKKNPPGKSPGGHSLQGHRKLSQHSTELQVTWYPAVGT